MRNPVTRAIRYMKREHPILSFMGPIIGLGLGAVVEGAAFLGMSLDAVILFGIAYGACTAMGCVLMDMDLPSYGRKETVNGITLEGDRRDVANIGMTQRIIDNLTYGAEHRSELSRRTEKKVKAYISDISDSLARVRAYRSTLFDHKEPVTSFPFTRFYSDAEEHLSIVTVANCDVTPGGGVKKNRTPGLAVAFDPGSKKADTSAPSTGQPTFPPTPPSGKPRP
jgi:hypothetical protein